MKIPRVPVADLMRFRAPAHDWPQLLRQLNQKGISTKAIATVCGRTQEGVNGWKNRKRQPRHCDGETVLALHREFCGDQPERVANMTIRHLKDGDIKIRCGG